MGARPALGPTPPAAAAAGPGLPLAAAKDCGHDAFMGAPEAPSFAATCSSARHILRDGTPAF
eukprot:402613-Pelagomonas_calceolata.AAC.1